jgi:hypothetical protein
VVPLSYDRCVVPMSIVCWPVRLSLIVPILAMRIRKKLIFRTCATALAIIGFYWLLMVLPQPLFNSPVRANNLELYSDRPFEESAGKHVLELVQAKLAASPLYSPLQNHSIFVCNAKWRQRLLFSTVYGVAGVNRYPFTTNVFMRDAIIEENCLIGPSGNRVPGVRTLDYFIAHEIAHTLTGQAIGGLKFHRLPQWVREGYADYVGKGHAFDYEEAKKAFLANVPEMDWARSGLYWRYNLLVAFLLEKQGWSVQRLLEQPVDQKAVEEMIRADKP